MDFAVSASVMKQICATIEQSGAPGHRGVTDADMRTMATLFGQRSLGKALDMLDKRRNATTRLVAQPSGRTLFQIEGSKGEKYKCMPPYCSCPSGTGQVGASGSKFAPRSAEGSKYGCKHSIAAQLAVALGTCTELVVSDAELAAQLRNAPEEWTLTMAGGGGGGGGGGGASSSAMPPPAFVAALTVGLR